MFKLFLFSIKRLLVLTFALFIALLTFGIIHTVYKGVPPQIFFVLWVGYIIGFSIFAFKDRTKVKEET